MLLLNKVQMFTVQSVKWTCVCHLTCAVALLKGALEVRSSPALSCDVMLQQRCVSTFSQMANEQLGTICKCKIKRTNL